MKKINQLMLVTFNVSLLLFLPLGALLALCNNQHHVSYYIYSVTILNLYSKNYKIANRSLANLSRGLPLQTVESCLTL